MTGCDSDIYTVAMVLPVQKKVRAADADEAKAIALHEMDAARDTIIFTSSGMVSIGFPEVVEVVMEYSGQPAAKAD